MSGHSKWSKVKHQKASTDAVKGQAFTKASRAITIAVSEGGGVTDPAMNFKLRLAIEKAKEVNMPKDNIKRAIDRANGADSSNLMEVFYECFGPSGIAIMIKAVTDNRQRSVSAVKNILDRFGGSIANPGAVSYLFRRVGVITIAKTVAFDDLLSLAIVEGADDCVEREDVYEVYTSMANLSLVKEHLVAHGLHVDNADLIFLPTATVDIVPEKEKSLATLVGELERLEDVGAVYTNAA